MKNLKKLAASLAAFTTALSLSVGTLSVTANEIKKDIDKTFAEKAFVATFKDAKYKDAAKYLVDNGISLDDAKDIMTLYIEGDKEERPIKKVSSVKGAANTSTPPKPFYAKNYISDQQHYGVIIANRGDVYDDNVNFYLEYNRKLKESDPEPVINLGKVSNSDINSLNTAVTGLGCYFGPDVLIYCLDIWANIDMKSSADKITNICDFPIELKTKNTTEEKVRQAIIDTVALAASRDRFKVFILDEVHMLSASSFNALLKTIEEPPAHVVFILATTEKHKVPSTIVSRCQTFRFRPLTLDEITSHLMELAEAEGINLSEKAARLIAKNAGGAMRDALTLLDRSVAYSDGKIDEKLVSDMLGLTPQEQLCEVITALVQKDSAALHRVFEALRAEGADANSFLKDMKKSTA